MTPMSLYFLFLMFSIALILLTIIALQFINKFPPYLIFLKWKYVYFWFLTLSTIINQPSWE